MMRPSLPENFDDLDEREKELYRRRLAHYHYVKNTKEYNELHYVALTDPMGMLRRRLFSYASDPWEGETLALKVALIGATENWEMLMEGGPPLSCRVRHRGCTRDEEAGCRTERSGRESRGVREHSRLWGGGLGACRALRGGHDTQQAAEGESEEERAQIAAHWPLDDMDEEEYM